MIDFWATRKSLYQVLYDLFSNESGKVWQVIYRLMGTLQYLVDCKGEAVLCCNPMLCNVQILHGCRNFCICWKTNFFYVFFSQQRFSSHRFVDFCISLNRPAHLNFALYIEKTPRKNQFGKKSTKIKQLFSRVQQFNNGTAGGTVTLHVSPIRLNHTFSLQSLNIQTLRLVSLVSLTVIAQPIEQQRAVFCNNGLKTRRQTKYPRLLYYK